MLLLGLGGMPAVAQRIPEFQVQLDLYRMKMRNRGTEIRNALSDPPIEAGNVSAAAGRKGPGAP